MRLMAFFASFLRELPLQDTSLKQKWLQWALIKSIVRLSKMEFILLKLQPKATVTLRKLPSND